MTSDLDLARAALANDLEGLRAVDALIAGLPVSDEARQALRHRALVEKKLADFDGRGSLRSWLKTVAVRLEVDLRRASREDTTEDRVLEALLPPTATFESDVVAREARSLLADSLRGALEALPPRSKLWVRHYHLDGLTLTQIGSMYDVAPSTVMRAVDKALGELRALVSTHLRETNNLGAASLESLVRHGVP